MSSDIPDITILQKEKKEREDAKHNVFNIVLNKCIEKIKTANSNTEHTYIIFEVPKILIGYSNYDSNACILYLMKQLTLKNYKVDFLPPSYLYIDWGIAQSISSHPKSNKINSTLKKQTRKLLKQFPNSSKVEFEYI